MAMFKQESHLWKSMCDVFEEEYLPGTVAPWTGIYSCQTCNHEIAANEGELLPAPDHHHHASAHPINWRLIVYADQRAKVIEQRPHF